MMKNNECQEIICKKKKKKKGKKNSPERGKFILKILVMEIW